MSHWHVYQHGGYDDGLVSERFETVAAAEARVNEQVASLLLDEPEEEYEVMGSPKDGMLVVFYGLNRRPYMRIEVVARATDHQTECAAC